MVSQTKNQGGYCYDHRCDELHVLSCEFLENWVRGNLLKEKEVAPSLSSS